MEENKYHLTFEEKIKKIKEKHLQTEEIVTEFDSKKAKCRLQKLFINPKFKEVVSIIQPEISETNKKEKPNNFDLLINKFFNDFKNRNKENQIPKKRNKPTKTTKPVKEQLEELRNEFLSVRNTYESTHHKHKPEYNILQPLKRNNKSSFNFFNKSKRDLLLDLIPTKNYFRSKLYV
jgi:hypothetical protein